MLIYWEYIDNAELHKNAFEWMSIVISINDALL